MKGTVCIVTGASGHTGHAIAEEFASAGARVFGAVSPRCTVGSIERTSWVPMSADLTNEDSVRRLFDEVERQAGSVQIVVHVAGGYASSGPVSETSVEVWDRMINTNLRSAFLVTRESVRRMREAAYGRIILFGAKSGFGVPVGRVAYGLSKSGVHLLVQTAALENTNKGVTINAIAPGIIDTPANRSSMPDADRSSWVTTEQIVLALRKWCDPASVTSGNILQM